MIRDQYTYLNDPTIYANQEQIKWYLVRNRWNGYGAGRGISYDENGKPLDDVGGGQLFSGPASHSFADFFPADKYFKEHPEYYSERNGKRVPSNGADGNHLCLTNPDVLKLMIQKVKAQFDAMPAATTVSVSENDGGCATLCDCPVCRAKSAEMGGDSGLLLWFVNQVADAIKKEYPGKYISTLAYIATATPPTGPVKPRDNVIMFVASGLSSGAVYNPVGINSFGMKNLAGWAAISPHVQGWDYVNSEINYFAPVIWHMDQQFKFIAKTHIDGLFQENELIWSPSVMAEFYEMRMWVASKLMERPNRDINQLIRDFISGYYGPAAPYLMKYIELQRKRLPEYPYRMANYSYISTAQGLFDQAENAVKDIPEFLSRVSGPAYLPGYYRIEFPVAACTGLLRRRRHRGNLSI